MTSFLCLLTSSWTLCFAVSILLVVSWNGSYISLAPMWKDQTDASIDDTATARTSGTLLMTVTSFSWTSISTSAAALAIMLNPDGKFLTGVVSVWIFPLSFLSLSIIYAFWLDLSFVIAGIFCLPHSLHLSPLLNLALQWLLVHQHLEQLVLWILQPLQFLLMWSLVCLLSTNKNWVLMVLVAFCYNSPSPKLETKQKGATI